MIAEERPPCRKPHSNTTTCQHCRHKPNPSSTEAPVNHDPVHSDVRHQGVEEETLVSAPVQGGGRVHVQEEYVSRLLPEPPDTQHVEQGQYQPALNMEDDFMHKASHRRRVEVESNKANRARDRRK